MTTNLATDNLSQENVKLIGNRYIIKKTLGSGNCGTAFLTLDGKTKNFEKKVIKRICIGTLALEDTVTAANEGKLLKGLQHNNIITYFDSFLDGEFYCIVTEFCDEGDLDSKIQENKGKGVWLEEEQIIAWIVQLLKALEYIHSRNILHRDLKTKNIFLKQGGVKIGDFGISRILATPTELADTFIGTPYYMSPEVLNHQGYNTKSDVWSVGCVLYDLANYEHPFKGTSLVAIISSIIHSAHPLWPRRYCSQLGDVFRLLTERDQSRRPTAEEALQIPFLKAYHQAAKNKAEHTIEVRRSRDQIFKTMKQKTCLEELKMETELKMMPPRDRLRIRRIIKADREALRIRDAARQRHIETHQQYAAIKKSLDPFRSSITFGRVEKIKKANVSGRSSLPCNFEDVPENAESAEKYYSQFEDFENDEEEMMNMNDDHDLTLVSRSKNEDSEEENRNELAVDETKDGRRNKEDEEIMEEIEEVTSDDENISFRSSSSSRTSSSSSNSSCSGSESNLVKNFQEALNSHDQTISERTVVSHITDPSNH